jgi:ATP-dependent Lhr-like helicase
MGMTVDTILKDHPLTKWLQGQGWDYHAHQLDVLEAALGGKDVLLTAPTGSGKTFAGFLPSIIDLTNSQNPSPFGLTKGSQATINKDPLVKPKDDEKKQKQKLHTLYISPLKALAVDVHRNLQRPIDETDMNISVETRTGDTPASKRQRQKTKPPQMLMTTPESLALLTSYEEAPQYFAHLKYIIIDELHALMHSKRGDLLSLNLARLADIALQAQRIGLSATIPNAEVARDYICREGNGAIITASDAAKPKIDIHLSENRVPWAGHMATHAIPEIYERIRDTKMSVVFVNTRAQAELIFQALWDVNEDNLKIAVHHGSLERELRRKVEEKMASGELDCVVATSSLDLGLDWADVDLVVQIGAPKGVSRLLQRIGRSNHRMGEASNALLVPANRFEYLECLAAREAIAEGELDGVHPRTGGLDVLAQHITGVACSGPFNPDRLYENVTQAWPYRNLKRHMFDRAVEFVRNGGYALQNYERYARLIEVSASQENPHPTSPDGSATLSLKGEGKPTKGRQGEGHSLPATPYLKISHKKFIQQYRMNIGTIVESNMIKVKMRMKTLGKIEEWFIQGLSPGDTFVFAGMVLRYASINEHGLQVSKTSERSPRIPSYAGGRMPLSTELSSRVRTFLNRQDEWDNHPEPIREWLNLQDEKSVMPSEDGLLIETFQRQDRGKKKRHFMVAYTFEGRNAHQTLGFLLSRRMQRFGYKPLGFTANDYAMCLWSMNPIERVDHLFHPDIMLDDLHEWLQDTPLLKRNFRDCAVIAGLIERRHPGQQKTGKQVTFNSDLIYDVLMKYEPDHILLQAALDDAKGGLIDLTRLESMLHRVQGKIIHQKLDKVSPLAVPLILEVRRETINKEEVQDFYLQEFEDELLKEVGL